MCETRLADATIWNVNDSDPLGQLRKLGTGIKGFGDVKPDPLSRSLNNHHFPRVHVSPALSSPPSH
jgi:hypothetical protein